MSIWVISSVVTTTEHTTVMSKWIRSNSGLLNRGKDESEECIECSELDHFLLRKALSCVNLILILSLPIVVLVTIIYTKTSKNIL